MNSKLVHDLRTAEAQALTVKASPSGRIEGYASVFNNVDRHGDIVLRGAFLASLARMKSSDQKPPMLWAHAQEQPIGHWTSLEENATGLKAVGQLNLKTAGGREAFEHVAAGDASGLSIGFVTPEGGREYAGDGKFHLKEVDLLEISVVAIPANPAARIGGVKGFDTKAEAIDALRSIGLSKRMATRFAGGGFRAISEHYGTDKIQALAKSVELATQKIRGKST